MKTKLFFITLLATSLFSSLSAAEESPALPGNLDVYLPGKAEVSGWKRDGAPQEYKGEDLFLYINGGAEIYYEYGFRQVIVQDYQNKKVKSITLEIFEMNSGESAFGMYSFKTSSSGKEAALGDSGQLADYYLNFWKGDFVVTLTGFNEDEETREGLMRLGRAVEAKIEAKGNRPLLVSRLPQEGLIKQGIKYFKGHLGVFNSYPFFAHDVFHLREGARGDYEDGYSVFLFQYDSEEQCRVRYGEVETSFGESQRYQGFREIEASLFQATDRKGTGLFFTHFKNYLICILGAVSQHEARAVLEAVKRSINS